MIFLVPYAYDRMPGGKPREGVPANRLGTKARCDTLLEKLTSIVKKHNTLTYFFVLSVGYSKEDASKDFVVSANPAIRADIASYLRSVNPCCGILFSRNYSWGTYKETQSVMETIFSKTDRDPNLADIYVSTNLGHMPRVWLCWFFLKPKGWKVRFILAKHSFTLKEYFQETGKFLLYLYCFIFKKW